MQLILTECLTSLSTPPFNLTSIVRPGFSLHSIQHSANQGWCLAGAGRLHLWASLSLQWAQSTRVPHPLSCSLPETPNAGVWALGFCFVSWLLLSSRATIFLRTMKLLEAPCYLPRNWIFFLPPHSWTRFSLLWARHCTRLWIYQDVKPQSLPSRSTGEWGRV